jgi:predicted ATPase
VLAERFERARGGQGQVVFIAGEPGIGKSRLLLEFRRRLADEALWLEGHCMSFGRSIALHPLVDMLRRAFRIEEGDSEEVMIRKIERNVLLLGEDLRPILPHLRFLLSIDPGDPGLLDLDPSQRRAALFDAVRTLTVRAAEVRPHVFVYEDLHWTDTATEEYLAFVANSVASSRALVIVTYRPGYVHRLGERSFHTRLALNALSTAEGEQMAEAVLATDALPEQLKALIVRKTEGNPFFIEEVMRSLQESGAIQPTGDGYAMAQPIEEIIVPDTVQDVIMARIDRLEEPAKKTLQLASVIGREFTRRLLDRIADIRGRTEEFLQELQAIELIYQRRIFPELAYMFKHALTHGVAYNSLLIGRRRELHRVIGLAIEELYADRLAEHYEVLAYHFLRSEEWSRAVHYLRQAANKAMARSANREAVVHLDEALGALGHLPDGPTRRSRPSTCDSSCAKPSRRLQSMAGPSICSARPTSSQSGSAIGAGSGWPMATPRNCSARSSTTSRLSRWASVPSPLPPTSATSHWARWRGSLSGARSMSWVTIAERWPSSGPTSRR